MIKLLNTLARVVASISLVVYTINITGDGQLYDNLKDVIELQFLNWIVLFMFSCLMLILLSCMFYLSISVLGKNLPALVSFKYTAMNNFFNTLLPAKAGTVIRGAYLKNQFSVNWLDYFIVTTFTQGLNVFILLLVALILIPLNVLTNFDVANDTIEAMNIQLLLIILTIVIALVFMLRNKVMALVVAFSKGVARWYYKPKTLLIYLFNMSLFHWVSSVRLWLCFVFSGSSVTYLDCLSIYCLVSAGLSFAVTPGNIGIRESAIVLVASLFLLDVELALTASIIDRLVGLSTTLLIGGIATYSVTRKPHIQDL